jgi:biofilm PGA synthesis N-glycosyltransferase PgaC
MNALETRSSQRRAAVLIAAHNEEPVITATLESVLVSYDPGDVFVFDDASTDRTAQLAEQYLPKENVLRHDTNIGKSRGLEYALEQRIYAAGYEFVTIVDADTTMEPEYRERALDALDDAEVICAAGQVKSRPDGANLVSLYRAWLYFIWQALFKRVQSTVNAISIAPGCSSTWRIAALRQIHFDHRMSTEDFHLSIAVHRQRLGRIAYVAGAIVWTQDPLTIRAFIRQSFRWSRAWWEVVRHHGVGLRWIVRGPDGRWRVSALDLVSFVIVASLLFFVGRLVLMTAFLLVPDASPPALVSPGGRDGLLLDLGLQFAFLFGLLTIASLGARRPLILLLAPLVAALIVVDFVVSMRALGSVLWRTFPDRGGLPAAGWRSPERRAFTGGAGAASAASMRPPRDAPAVPLDRREARDDGANGTAPGTRVR